MIIFPVDLSGELTMLRLILISNFQDLKRNKGERIKGKLKVKAFPLVSYR